MQVCANMSNAPTGNKALIFTVMKTAHLGIPLAHGSVNFALRFKSIHCSLNQEYM